MQCRSLPLGGCQLRVMCVPTGDAILAATLGRLGGSWAPQVRGFLPSYTQLGARPVAPGDPLPVTMTGGLGHQGSEPGTGARAARLPQHRAWKLLSQLAFASPLDSVAASVLFPQIPFCLVSLSWWFLSRRFPPDKEIRSQVIKENLMIPGGH